MLLPPDRRLNVLILCCHGRFIHLAMVCATIATEKVFPRDAVCLVAMLPDIPEGTYVTSA